MPAKPTQSAAQILTVLFTSLIAPIIVSVVAQDVNERKTTPIRSELRATAEPSAACPAAQTKGNDALISLIADGTGHTPEQAVQDAFRAGLGRALATQLDGETWRRYEPAVTALAWQRAERVIRAWREVNVSRQWRLGGAVHRATIALDIDQQALLDCLRAASGDRPPLR